jgi:hypothetical protein
MDSVEASSEGTSFTLETKEALDKGRTPSLVPASEANLLSLQKEFKIVVIREFSRNIASGTRITGKERRTAGPHRTPSFKKASSSSPFALKRINP